MNKRSIFAKVSNEELEGAEGTVEVPYVDPVEVIEAEETLPDDMVELQQDIVALEEAEAIQGDLTAVLDGLTNVGKPSEDGVVNEPTDEAMAVANEAYKAACYKLGLTPTINYSSEDLTHDKLRLTTEGIKEVVGKIVEAIKTMIHKIAVFVKKMYVKFLVLVNNDAKKAQDLEKRFNEALKKVDLEGDDDIQVKLDGSRTFIDKTIGHTLFKRFSMIGAITQNGINSVNDFSNGILHADSILSESSLEEINRDTYVIEFSNLNKQSIMHLINSGDTDLEKSKKYLLDTNFSLYAIKGPSAYVFYSRDKSGKLPNIKFDTINLKGLASGAVSEDNYKFTGTSKSWTETWYELKAMHVGFARDLVKLVVKNSAGLKTAYTNQEKNMAEIKKFVDEASKRTDLTEEQTANLNFTQKYVTASSRIMVDRASGFLYLNKSILILLEATTSALEKIANKAK